MTQSHQSSRLLIKGQVCAVNFSSAYFNYDYDATGIQYGELISPSGTSVYTIRDKEGIYGGGVAVDEPTTNFYPGIGTGNAVPGIYNNFGTGISANIIQLANETLYDMPIYRLTMSPVSANALTSMQTEMYSHGILSPSTYTFLSGTAYAQSIYWRSPNTDVQMSGEPTNSMSWIDQAQVINAGANVWNRSVVYVDGTATGNITDNMFWAFKSPSVQLSGSVVIDFSCPQLEKGRMFATSFVKTFRLSGGSLLYDCDRINASTGAFSFWVNRSNSTNSYANLFSMLQIGAANTNRLSIERSGSTDTFGIVTASGAGNGVANNILDIPPNIWTHIAVSWNNGTYKAYKNGVLLSTWNPTVYPSSFANSTIQIGYTSEWAGREANAIIDDLRIDCSVPSDEEIYAWYISGVPFYNPWDRRSFAV